MTKNQLDFVLAAFLPAKAQRQFPPSCFPSALHATTSEPLQRKFGMDEPVFKQFSAAWEAIKYRYAAIVEYDEQFTATMKHHGPGPEAAHRYAQERDLFSFASAACSMFDAYIYGVYAIGALHRPDVFKQFELRKEQCIDLRKTMASYRKAFPGDAMSKFIKDFEEDTEHEELRLFRNVLTHRAVSPRSFQIGRPDLPAAKLELFGIAFDDSLTKSRRLFAQGQLLACLKASADFVDRHY